MPIVKLVKYNNQADHYPSTLGKVLNYCCQPNKTEIDVEVYSVTGQNCVPQIAYEQFVATKEYWKKTEGVCFRHYVQSFDPKEKITPMQANEIAKEFVAKAWDGYEVLIATHRDRQHIHTHMIINTVHPETGKHLHEGPDHITNLRTISDEICKTHGIKTLPPYDGKKQNNAMGSGEYHTATRGQSWKIRLRIAIGQAMEWSYTREEFIDNMKRLGYGVRWEDGRKNITYTCFREQKFKDGKYPKSNDDKLTDPKYLKGEMEYEFTIRSERFFGRTDEEESTKANTGTEYGSDQRGGMEPTFGSAPTHGRTDPGGTDRTEDADGHRRKVPLGDEESVGSADRIGSESDQDDRGERRRTSWESERESLARHRTPNDSRRVPVVAPSASHGTAHGVGAVFGGLFGLASAASVIDNGDPDETEEAKKEREARETGSAIGAVLGTAIGIVTARKARHADENTSAGQVPDEAKTPAEAGNEDDNAFDISM